MVSGSSDDYKKLKSVGKVIPAGGFRHRIYLLASQARISSSDRDTFMPFGEKMEWNKDKIYAAPYIFLQHGITKDDMSDWLNRWNQNFAGFVTAAGPEFRSILDGDYGYTEDEVWMTGFPRFDRLEDRREKIITIIPTWRRGLMGAFSADTGERELLAGFRNTGYYSFFHELLNSDKLLDSAERTGYTVLFRPHPQIAKYASEFQPDRRVKIVSSETRYQELFARSSLMVTDYSSAVFDFAYLRKPVIYAQFDRETVFGGGHIYKKGYFDYDRDGFGPVTKTPEETVKRIINYMETGCEMEDEYKLRADGFFAFRDRNNCARVYEKISKTIKRPGKI